MRIEKVATTVALRALPMHSVGRQLVEKTSDGASSYAFQWPGMYFEVAFDGTEAFFKVGAGEQNLRFTVDHDAAVSLVKPDVGTYRIANLAAGRHVIRLEFVNESQAGPIHFGGFFLSADAKAISISKRARQIEFIGDSHTVGYGNTSTARQCTLAEIWTTTDNSQAYGALTAKHERADFQANAISGRGVVRNYNGFVADPLPVVYPFVLFDKKTAVAGQSWRPQIIVINLGTNDFTTPLNPGEKWKTRDELHLDFETTYVKFVQSLRAKNPQAFFILLANDGANGEIQIEVQKVLGQLKNSGETRIEYIPINQMSLTACDWHPSLADHKMMSEAVTKFIEAHPELWQGM